ncbi:hypothetical protein KJN74_04710 [Candidatus Bathyarchaeota archaeon]|nr:hypothetical protein [Candidatus Bathyarchaeota archaeon]
MRGFRDRDFIQTNEGFYFCVIGTMHPPDRVISYIKYVPSKSGIWGSTSKKYQRILKKYTIPDLLETFSYLKQNFPNYLFHSSVDNIEITAVPLIDIKEHFKPEKKLAFLRKTPILDSLQEKLIRITGFLEKLSGISEEMLGVTGSLLLDIHNPKFSDIDITVYGLKNSWTLRKTLIETNQKSTILRLKGKDLKDWCNNKTNFYPLTSKDALKIYRRKWNLGVFENTWISIHPIRLENEVKKKFGEITYNPCGQVIIECIVSDNSESLFIPGIYKIKNVNLKKGPKHLEITEVVTYETLYTGLAEIDEKIQVKGKLEKVIEKENKKEYYRVLVGSIEGNGKEYIKLVD